MVDENYAPDPCCTSDAHGDHLCVLTEQYYHMHEASEYRILVAEPRFNRQFCGRTARSRESLCSPVEL